jgi:hypothetical protein
VTVWTTQLAARQAKTLKGLRRGNLVNQMEIDVEDRRLACRFRNEVLLPYFLE